MVSGQIEVGVSVMSSMSLLTILSVHAEIPQRIHKDRISNYSIRLPGFSAMQMPGLPSMSIMGLGSSTTKSEIDKKEKDPEGTGEEQWTRACRAVLTVLKRVLVVESEAERAVVGANAPV